MENKINMVKQWWLLFHDTNPQLNLISSIQRTELLNHVQVHVISKDDYDSLSKDLKQLMTEYKNIQEHLKTACEQRDLAEAKLEIALVALKSVARNDVNWSHAIVEKALKEIEES